MDVLLLAYLQATDSSTRQQCLDELLLLHASPVVRQILRRKLGFYVTAQGTNPHNEAAEDLYQDVITKVVQALNDLSASNRLSEIKDFRQYVGRIATNACIDVLRAKSPARARLKNNLRFLLTHHKDFAVWQIGTETLCGFAEWRDTNTSESSERLLSDLDETANTFRVEKKYRTQWRLTKLVAEVLDWIGGPLELNTFVALIARITDVTDQVAESIDDESSSYLNAISSSSVSTSSSLEEQAVLHSLWQAVKELSAEQRDVFCFGFEDDAGRDLFTLLVEAEITSVEDLAKELGRSVEEIVLLWAKMPMDDASIASELESTKPQVYKWRFRALERLRRGLLPFSKDQ